ncbi:DUF4136 domain-containing protein [Pseudofulvibacter geojedonensis]|uniref:DUF4136 domain-containing protein n=1 Tax=Pseudofulvibacter geojedonensis TaxID=1123758 RepID=A0ABW3I598_9FLAO
MIKKGLIIVVLLIVACAPVKVNYDYNKAVDFTKYKTYNYASEIKTGLSELDEKRLYFQLDSLLTVNGISKSESPDFYIDLHTKTYKNPSNNSIGIGVGGGGRSGGVGVSGGIPIGGNDLNQELLIDFLDGEKHSLVWQAQVTKSMKEKASPEARKAHFRAMVQKALEGYPPKVKK